jgi:sterol desaturase/sphingolipid hydroxylase (fatty acid hydroxylase superfamily)
VLLGHQLTGPSEEEEFVQENRNISVHLQTFQTAILTNCSQSYLCGLQSLIQINCPPQNNQCKNVMFVCFQVNPTVVLLILLLLCLIMSIQAYTVKLLCRSMVVTILGIPVMHIIIRVIGYWHEIF